jgi:hypothetical protein
MSKYSDKLFIVNDKKGTLEINKKEARQVPSFRTIVERDKGGKVYGDPDGRKKYFAFKELYYIYIYVDPFSMYSILNDTRRHKQALESSGLIEFEDWKPDTVVKQAMEDYLKHVPLSPIAHAFINARKALYNIGEDLKLFNDYADELREKIKDVKVDLDSEDESERQKAKSNLKDYIKQLGNINNEVLKTTNDLPERLNSLEKLKIKLSEEDNEREEIVGGGLIYNREDPK